jgi:hypothetical protein
MTLRPASALVWVEGADHYLDGYDEELAATTGWLAPLAKQKNADTPD